MAALTKLTPPKDLTETDRETVFQHFFRRLASHRNSAELYANAEYGLSQLEEVKKSRLRDAFVSEINSWAQSLLEKAWIVCQEPGGGECPVIDDLSDTSVGQLPRLPSSDHVAKVLNTILFLHITTSKQYSARTRSFLSTLGPLDEDVIVSTLKNPDRAIDEASRKTEEAKEEHAGRGRTFRMVGMGLGAVAGGVLVGVTGGLAAPLVGVGVTTILGWLGVGGTAAGLLASGLAGSSVVCGALFGVYGARSTANMVARHTREIRDLAVVPVTRPSKTKEESLAVRLCVSGWLTSPEDVVAPWTVFGGDDTFALQWEVEALNDLSDALMTLIKANAMKYVKVQIIKRTILASLMSSLSPIAWLKIGKIIDNPWMNAKALAVKAGAVLGDLLSNHLFGNRPVTLTGYSLGSLVIFEALKYLASLPPSKTSHLIQDVYIFGTPVPTDVSVWSSIRRLVSGRLVNGYATEDYVLAVLSRASDASWSVAGLNPVDVMGVDNVLCEDVDGHTKWRGMIGKCLQVCKAPGIIDKEVDRQLRDVAVKIEKETSLSQEEVDRLANAKPQAAEL